MVMAKQMDSATVQSAARAPGSAMKRLLAHDVTYWLVVLVSAAVLLWGWALALESVIKGTTVQLG